VSITPNPVAPGELVVLTAVGRGRLELRLAADRRQLAELEQQLDDAEDKDESLAERLRLQARIARLQAALARSVAIDAVAEDPDIVELGDEVELEFDDGDRSHIVLVHPVEANASQGHVSIDAPLAQALLGSHVGEDVSVNAPMGRYRVRVLDRRRSH
jgi:transcription elongation factor GreA